MIGVADGEGVGQRVIEGELRPVEVAHRRHEVGVAVGFQVGLHEGVHLPAVPAVVLRGPFVRDVVGAVAVVGRELLLQVERLQVARRVDADAGLVAVLVPHRHAAPGADLVREDMGSEKPRTPDNVPK